MRRPEITELVLAKRTRVVLFWFTLLLIAVVAVMAVVSIVRLRGPMRSEELAPPSLTPSEASLCPGESLQFSVSVEGAIWEASAGSISHTGLFTAGGTPGDVEVRARIPASGQVGSALIHVLDCRPTPLPMPSPTAIPTVVATATAEPIGLAEDAQGDVLTYDGTVPSAAIPPGIDIRLASIGPDRRLLLEPVASTPAELTAWVQDGELLLWLVSYEPVPADVFPYWVFALDTDANPATGRTPGTARINPDMGDEATVNLYYDTALGQYVAELSVWSPAQQDWIATTQPVRYVITESRTAVGLALSLSGLSQEVGRIANVTVQPEEIVARAAVLAYAGEEPVIDFYPDRPQ